MKRIMLAVFVICGALSLSGCILPPGPHGSDLHHVRLHGDQGEGYILKVTAHHRSQKQQA
jgi:hypothetical protein